MKQWLATARAGYKLFLLVVYVVSFSWPLSIGRIFFDYIGIGFLSAQMKLEYQALSRPLLLPCLPQCMTATPTVCSEASTKSSSFTTGIIHAWGTNWGY